MIWIQGVSLTWDKSSLPLLLNVGLHFVGFSTSSTNCLVDPTRGVIRKVLRSDMERFIKELAAAGKGSEEHVIEKHRSTVDERSEVSDWSVPYNFISPFILQFMSAIEALEGVAEKLKENARADVKKRRIERCVVHVYPLPSKSNNSPSPASGRNSLRKDGAKKLQLASRCMNQGSWKSKEWL